MAHSFSSNASFQTFTNQLVSFVRLIKVHGDSHDTILDWFGSCLSYLFFLANQQRLDSAVFLLFYQNSSFGPVFKSLIGGRIEHHAHNLSFAVTQFLLWSLKQQQILRTWVQSWFMLSVGLSGSFVILLGLGEGFGRRSAAVWQHREMELEIERPSWEGQSGAQVSAGFIIHVRIGKKI